MNERRLETTGHNGEKSQESPETALLKYFATGVSMESIGEVISVELCDDGGSSNHLNYKVTTSVGENYIARVEKPGNPISGSDLKNEFLILEIVKDLGIAPIPYSFDAENFSTPLLIEEYVHGVPFSKVEDVSDMHFNEIVTLLVRISNLQITERDFPFQYTYSSYDTNLRNWNSRLQEIADSSSEAEIIANQSRDIAVKASEILQRHESLLSGAPVEFIYNDVHQGNLFWLPDENTAKFIDWQKVSLGDPSFMAALFIRRFYETWHMDVTSFKKKVLAAYLQQKNIPHFEQLLTLRMLERAVADMIWVNWAKIKNNQALVPMEENSHVKESELLISEI